MTSDSRRAVRGANRFALAVIVAFVGFSPQSPARTKHRSRARAAPAASAATDAPGSELSGLLPETARVYQKSYDEEAAGRFAQALGALDVLPSAEQASYLAQLRRGWLFYRLGRHAESIAAYHQALAVEKDSIEARVGCLMPELALRDWGAVEQGARGVLERDPANYLAGLRLAFAVYNAGRFAEAEALYRRVVARYPSDADARAGLGWSLLRQGKRAEARDQFLQAARAAPRSPLVVEGIKTSAG